MQDKPQLRDKFSKHDQNLGQLVFNQQEPNESVSNSESRKDSI